MTQTQSFVFGSGQGSGMVHCFLNRMADRGRSAHKWREFRDELLEVEIVYRLNGLFLACFLRSGRRVSARTLVRYGTVRYGTVRYGSPCTCIERVMHVLRTWCFNGRCPLRTCGTHAFGVRLPAFNQPSGVVLPVMELSVIIYEASALECCNERLTIAVVARGLGHLLGVKSAEVAFLGILERPPPEKVQMPDGAGHRNIECLSQTDRLGMTGEAGVRLDPGHARHPRGEENAGLDVVKSDTRMSSTSCGRASGCLQHRGRLSLYWGCSDILTHTKENHTRVSARV
jgi:hypothetical protein